MVGSAVVRRLATEACEVVTADRSELDLTRQEAVERFTLARRPDVVVLAAARVGGILANRDLPASFLYENLAIAANVIEAAHRAGVSRLLFLGSSCIYPRDAAQPIGEDSLLTGPLEPTNEAYAVAKIAGLKLVQTYRRQHGRDYIAAMPTNLYGPGDNYDLASGHVMAALIRKICEAKHRGDPAITLWGTGSPRREFLHVDDCADALVHLLKAYADDAPINVGTGEDIAILDLARLISDVAGYGGEIRHDLSKPDGTPRKRLDVSRLAASGWSPRIGLRDGIAAIYAAYERSMA
ncbi:MAG: GDP-L-fucose synthase [Caulobacteraceae bacterium]|nr:GDP-L-fucose synthase [Caulobacter sp.]